VGVTALTALMAGAAPAFQVSRADVNEILKDEGRGSSSLRAGKLGACSWWSRWRSRCAAGRRRPHDAQHGGR
jgi:hypothetical protein